MFLTKIDFLGKTLIDFQANDLSNLTGPLMQFDTIELLYFQVKDLTAALQGAREIIEHRCFKLYKFMNFQKNQ